MSNNIYDILKKMQTLEAPEQTLVEGKKAKPDFADLDKDGDKKEPMKKAAKEKGAIAEAVARVEQQLAEKYMGFKKTVSAIKKGGSAEDPEAVAAAIGRKKYGKAKFQKAAAAGKKLGEGEYNEDMLSPAQKKFAALAEPKDKITYADKIAGAKKKQKDEGNEFSGELVKARAQGKDSFEVDGKEYPVKEGWDEMQSYLKKKQGPQPKGASGKIAGKRYGGSAQSDEPETDNETGEVAKKGRGRPKKDKFAK